MASILLPRHQREHGETESIKRNNLSMMIVSASEDGTCRVWDGDTAECFLVVNFRMGRAWSLVAAPLKDSTIIQLAVGFDEGCVCLDIVKSNRDSVEDLEKNVSHGDDDRLPLMASTTTTSSNTFWNQWKTNQAFILSEVDPPPTACATQVKQLCLEHELQYDKKLRPFSYVSVKRNASVQ